MRSFISVPSPRYPKSAEVTTHVKKWNIFLTIPKHGNNTINILYLESIALNEHRLYTYFCISSKPMCHIEYFKWWQACFKIEIECNETSWVLIHPTQSTRFGYIFEWPKHQLLNIYVHVCICNAFIDNSWVSTHLVMKWWSYANSNIGDRFKLNPHHNNTPFHN